MGWSETFPEFEDAALPRRPNSSGTGKSKARRRGAGRWRKIGGAAIILGIVAGAGWAVARFALYDYRFRFVSLQIQGSKFVSASEIEEKFSADRNGGILRVPLDRRLRQIDDIPWVKSATLRRRLPNQLSVTVSERVPVAFLRRADGMSLVDEDGVILEPPKEASFRFPVVRGLDAAEAAESRRAKMQLFMALMKDLDRGGLQSSSVISEVDLEDPQDARIVVGDAAGAILLHLGQENFLARYLVYIGHIDEWKQKYPEIQSVDLRYDRQVVINSGSPNDGNGKQEKHAAAAIATRKIPPAPKAAASPSQHQPPL